MIKQSDFRFTDLNYHFIKIKKAASDTETASLYKIQALFIAFSLALCQSNP